MSFEFDAPEDVDAGGGNFLEVGGTFHLLISEVEENPTTKAGKSIDGFRVNFHVLDGTVRTKDGCTEIGKSVKLIFRNPDMSSKDGGNFARKKQARFLIAVGLLREDDLGKKGLKIDLAQAKDRQVVATLELSQPKEGETKQYLDLHYADIFHIDDPAAAAFPKDMKAIGLLPTAQRRKAESFASPKKAETKQPVGAGAAASVGDSSIDDL